MKILIIGGTKFLGRYLVEEALKNNHDVTLFNRGTNKDEFNHVEQINGNRNTDIDLLKSGKWDAVIDTCGYLPQSVEKSVRVLKNHVNQYVFISTISVYKDFSQNDYNEEAELLEMTREESDKLTKDNDSVIMSHYGELKALCEKELLNTIPEKSLIIRPGLIVGPYDGSDRFTYWVTRINEGGEVLAPGNPNRTVQFIDVRDLAKWTIHMVEKGKNGTYNATGMNKELTMNSVLTSIKQGLGSDAEFTWASDEFLLKNQVGPWMELPLWLPETPLEDGKVMSGMLAANTDRALAEGLSFRSVGETALDTLNWYKDYRDANPLRAGMSREKEGLLLNNLRSSSVLEEK
jgi:2'-hydroxyisoflavone reductase